ncbi:Thiol:disulfide interchange protein DsbA precursor [compost metagenome]|uniref:Thiol:disulfide interchange protein n=1 Tax=Variovorax boronicumulans TaxID=436515 RepID=A0A250DD04_9BURK|nr:thiol:disulfide interchange protein DsbA/DsbL [Variovorax boronicumulans]ATA52248.1 disulfide bond formation protein DsbA [Variovorax boronicumulans]MDP9876838.1 thiol:disulfide interchange protein DsbA [Variovorax boronicumulans]MDP9914158.1 thiol:disulfide interchange protein DsbA [Variovorax boronicumulans]MDP9922285.1 thiol:disulfide interchange protein DsbA [Variovorax boronicumulans]GER13493.1 thiol:disulfide interchange protein DsbA/DsbL [Variovorax boronicumulans]
MKRRDFSLAATSIGLLSLAAVPAHAQRAPKAGTDFLVLDKRVPVDAPAGKVEVVEFFSYNCPHCNDFEPSLEAWVKAAPKEVAFRRIPVPFVGNDVEAKQRLYFTLEAMGKLDEYHPKVFAAIHAQRQNLNGDANIQAWAERAGLDGAKFKETFASFGVASKARRAAQQTEAYKVAGVPALAVAGRWYVDGETAGSMSKVLQVATFLIGEAKKG